jgi:hypothetical protein
METTPDTPDIRSQTRRVKRSAGTEVVDDSITKCGGALTRSTYWFTANGFLVIHDSDWPYLAAALLSTLMLVVMLTMV